MKANVYTIHWCICRLGSAADRPRKECRVAVVDEASKQVVFYSRVPRLAIGASTKACLMRCQKSLRERSGRNDKPQ